MSVPNIFLPANFDHTSDPLTETYISNSLSFSIALEEMGLAHIMNALGEAMQLISDIDISTKGKGLLYNCGAGNGCGLDKLPTPEMLVEIENYIGCVAMTSANFEKVLACELCAVLKNNVDVDITNLDCLEDLDCCPSATPCGCNPTTP